MIKKSNFKVAIIGLGYVGLPLYLLCKKKQIDVFGYDIDQKKINQIKKNISYIMDIKNSELKKIQNKNIFTMNEPESISSRNIIIFCLPTPVKKNNSPDMNYIKRALLKISKFVQDKTIMIVESTVYPGATREIFEEFKKKKINKNINYGFSSERISPGQTDKKKFKIRYNSIPKVISANNEKSLKEINTFYKYLFKKTFVAKSIEIAEMSKLLENSYRSVNIGLVNEFKMLCNKKKINIYDVISAAATKPFGFTAFSPGPGVGGHCIPIDPLFVSWFAKKNKMSADFIELARKKNLQITDWLYKKILKLLKNFKKEKKKILLIGVAYKENINDYRESPALKLMKKLNKNLKVAVDYFDPHVPIIYTRKKKIYSIKNLKYISKYNIVILVTNHSNLPYKKILNDSKILVDTRGQFKNINKSNLYNF